MRSFLPHIAVLLAVTLAGCSSENDAGSIGQSVGRNVTEFAQGVGSGVDAQMEVEIELSEALIDSGISATVAKQEAPLDNPQKPITIYLISSKPITATLVAKAYNDQQQEIGRASIDVEFQADDAQYIKFAFPPEMDRQTVSVYHIDMRPIEQDAEQSNDADPGEETGT